MEENNVPVELNIEEHLKVLEAQMVLLAQRHANGTLSESDNALFLALHSNNALMADLHEKLRVMGNTVSTQAATIEAMRASQKLVIDLLQRWHGIDVSDASPATGGA